MDFFVGMHQVSDVHQFDTSFISVNRLRKRRSPFTVNRWIMDSGAFTEISTHGHYRHSVEEYAKEINRWKHNGTLLAAVSQDYMCEPFILKKTGLTVADHQQLSIERYEALKVLTDVYILPVLQGFAPSEYVQHIRMYGDRLAPGQWVGVGSICKRNADPSAIVAVLEAIHRERPDLRLHGFGLKLTALADPRVRVHLHTADSMSWSFAARMELSRRGKGHGANSPIEAAKFVDRINYFMLLDDPMF